MTDGLGTGAADREMLARVCWPRLLDLAPLTIDERRVIGELWQIVVSEDDEITRTARERCLLDALSRTPRPIKPAQPTYECGGKLRDDGTVKWLIWPFLVVFAIGVVALVVSHV